MRTTPDLSTASWRKSSHSKGDGGACLEDADGLPALVPVQDPKNPDGPVLLFPAAVWDAFLVGLKTGRLPS